MTYKLTAASVDLRGAITLSFIVAGSQPTAGSLLFSTTFFSDDGVHLAQLGFKLVDDQVAAAFCFVASETPMQRNYATKPGRTGDIWTIGFPIDALPPAAVQAAKEGRWRADLDISGHSGDSVQGRPSATISGDE